MEGVITRFRRSLPKNPIEWFFSMITLFVVASSSLFVLSQLHPNLLILNNLTTGGDMGAHSWAPWYMKNHLWPHGTIMGWARDWLAGFPLYYFYFPLPGFVIALLSYAVPYGIAFKLVTVSGVISMPISAYAYGKLSRLSYPTPAVLAAAMIPFLFEGGYTILGGNIASTLAGEYSFSIGLSLSFIFLGLVNRGLEDRKHRAFTAIVFAAIVLTHILPTLFALLAASLTLLVRFFRKAVCVDGGQYRDSKLRLFLSWATPVIFVGSLLSAFWAIPFALRSHYMNDMGWEKLGSNPNNGMEMFGFNVTSYSEALFPKPMEPVLIIAAIGAMAIVYLRRSEGIAWLLTALACAVSFIVMPQGRLWNARILPFFYLAIYVLAAFAIAELGRSVANWFGKKSWGIDVADGLKLATPLMAFVLVLTMIVPTIPKPDWWSLSQSPFYKENASGNSGTVESFIPSWSKWNYAGYDGKTESGDYYKPDYPEFKSVVNMVKDVGQKNGCGRVMWEHEPQLDRFGTPMAFMMFPLITNGCMGSMEGLYFESSPNVPYHFLLQSLMSKNPSRPMRDLPYEELNVYKGVDRLVQMGVPYYLAISNEAQAQADMDKRLQRVAETKADLLQPESTRTWVMYKIEGVNPVSPALYEPNVLVDPNSITTRRSGEQSKLSSRESWIENQLAWYADASNLEIPIAEKGSMEWPRIDNGQSSLVRRPVADPAVISRIGISDNRISFRVENPGAPVIINEGYFPNWKAEGAKGPYRVSPSQMIVIPTSNEVSVYFGRTPVDYLGWFMFIAGLVLLFLMNKVDRRVPALRYESKPVTKSQHGTTEPEHTDQEKPAE